MSEVKIMIKLSKVLAAVLVAVSLTLTTFAAARPAEAKAPPPPSAAATQDAEGSRTYKFEYRKVSKAKKANIKAALSIAQHAVGGKKRTTLNYKKADTYDRGKTKVRRQFAAGWLWSGKKITTISKTELKKVKKHLPKRKRPMSMGIMLADGVSCPGRSGVVKRSNGIDVYLNRCETTNLKAGLNTVAWITAIVAVGIGVRPPGVVAGVVAALASGGNDMIDALQDYSGTGSIWFRMRSTPLGLTTYVLPQP